MSEKIVELLLSLKEIDYVEGALNYFIDQKKEGDEQDKIAARGAEKVYEKIYKQLKWYSR